ncbi:MAG: phosphatidate cytidylyltransferase [Myxococcales bacterium]|nr:phosphatidate cytidylyltransferase [Myxococcales bacterium]
MKDVNKNLLIRIIAALVLIPVVVLCLWLGTLATAIFMALASVLMVQEFCAITLKKHDLGQVIGIAAAAMPALAFALWPANVGNVIAIEAALLLIALFVTYLLLGPLPEAPTRIALVFLGFFYAGVLPCCLVGLRDRPDGMAWVFFAFLLTWCNDTGAYAFGRALGKRKLYPAVSPAKSWEGFFGGMLTTVGIAFLARATFLPGLTWIDALAIALPVAILGPLGDLSESMLKRAYGVKDSGKTIPGHGGALDRLDAMLFTAPYVYFYVSFVLKAG